MGNVTMRDIGRMMGVSAVTVSKALAGKSGVSEEMRRKIIRTAQELGYVNPNASQGRALQGLDVGILVPDHYFSPDSFYAMLYKQLVQALTEAGHFGILELLGQEAESSLALPNLIRSRHVDALVLLGQPRQEYVRMIARQDTPVVFLDFYDESAEADAVVGDNAYGCYRLTSHLIKNGHRDIGFVGDRKATSSIMDRYLGFYRAMLMNDLPIREECILIDRDARSQRRTLALPEKLPTAFVCNCDIVAQWLIEQLNQMGLRVPEDVSVTGFDDFLPSGTSEPALSTFRLDSRAMVQMTVRLITERCSGVDKPFGRFVVGGEPFYRNSDIPLNQTTIKEER